MSSRTVSTDRAPQAIGPYSQAVDTGTMVFCSGQLGVEPSMGELVDGGVGPQTRQALANLSKVLEAAGAGLDSVVKTTVFLQDLSDFAEMNEAYGAFFGGSLPARSTVEVAGLPKGAAVEIEAVAFKS